MLKPKLFFLWGLLIIQAAQQKALSNFFFFLLHATISHFSSTACHTFSLSTQGQNEFQSWIMASNEIIPKWHCEIAGWEKVPLVSRLILFAHLSLICWSHTLSRRSAAALYICLRCGGWWQGVKSAVWELSDVPVCASVAVTWDTSCLSHLSFLRTVKGARRGGGGKKKEQTRRQWPLTNLTSVIGVHRCQRTNQIKMNGAYPGPLEARLIGPNFISGSNCSYRKINRASDHAAVQETQAHTNRFLLDGRGGVITVLRHRKRRWKRLRRGPPLWWLIEKAPQWQTHLWRLDVSTASCHRATV